MEKDPTEKGERALLNFGHTLGHALEKQMNFTASSWTVCCCWVSAVPLTFPGRGSCFPTEEFFEIRDMNVGFDLPISFLDALDCRTRFCKATKSDKKMEHGQIKFVLLKGIGKAFVDQTVTNEEMLAAIRYFRDDEEAAYE